MEHPELIESAFVSLLQAQQWPNPIQLYPGENNLDKAGQRIVAYINGEMGEEEPPCSGNRWADVIIQLRTPFSKLSAAEKTNGISDPLDLHKAAANILQSAILDNALPDKLSAAISGFTCFGVIDRKPMREQQENAWVSGWSVRMLSCPAAF